MLKWAMKSEEDAIDMYNEWALEASKARDAGTKQLFEEIISDEERHYDTFETEFTNLEKFGDNYLTQQAIERSKRMGVNPNTNN